MKKLKLAFAASFKDLKKVLDPWVLFKVLTGTEPTRVRRGGMIERDIKDCWECRILRESEFEKEYDTHDPHVSVIAKSCDREWIEFFKYEYEEIGSY